MFAKSFNYQNCIPDMSAIMGIFPNKIRAINWAPPSRFILRAIHRYSKITKLLQLGGSSQAMN